MERSPLVQASTAARVREVPLVTPRWCRFPHLPLALSALIGACALLPASRANPRLAWAFLGTAAVLGAWTALLGLARARRLSIELTRPLKAHYVQGCVQLCIYAYWGAYWPKVYSSAPLILSQMAFLFLFDGLLSWSRGRPWRLGLGPVPIVFSTNFFLWFTDDWFVFQFGMLALCALAKEFLRWNRDGKNTHIFNPSAFGLSIVSIVLIATHSTHLTWGIEVATTLGSPPHMYLALFALGLVVQYFFSVTLMTVSAVAALVVLDLAYNAHTGVYQFVDTNIPIAIFLGMHFLITDPATSPRTNVGRVIFGALYGVANFVLFTVLGDFGVPDFYDKLLPVPLLNLSVKWIDSVGRFSLLERFRQWEAKFRPRALNLVHMGCWVALFSVMFATGFVDAPHPGASVEFWRQAYREGKPDAGRKWLKMVGAQAEAGNASACNVLGNMYLEGTVSPPDRARALQGYSRACSYAHARGCENLAAQILARDERSSDGLLGPALDRIEAERANGTDRRGSFVLARAHETGRGRPLDRERARELYEEACAAGSLPACKALLRLRATETNARSDVSVALTALERACAGGDAESCLYVAHALHAGTGVAPDEARAVGLLRRACELGSKYACDELRGPATH